MKHNQNENKDQADGVFKVNHLIDKLSVSQLESDNIAIEVSLDEHYRSAFLKDLKESWPSMAKDFRHYCHTFSPKQGDVWVWTSPQGQKIVHCILDVESHSDHKFDKVHFFKLCFKKIKKLIHEKDFSKISFPMTAFNFSGDEKVQVANILQSLYESKTEDIQ